MDIKHYHAWTFAIAKLLYFLVCSLRSLIVAQNINFPDESGNSRSDLTRQQSLNVSTGIISGILTDTAPLQTGVTGTTQTCICVPTGRCNSTSMNNDGSGMLDIRIVTSSTSTDGTGITPNIVTPAVCASGLERCCVWGEYQCGLRFQPITSSDRLPGAGQAAYGEFPWQAVLLGPGDIYVGSGVLIDSLNVLTVAHRVSDYVSGSRTLKVRMGEWDASSESEVYPAQQYTVTRITIHPSYSSSNLKNDIAVLRLSSAVNLGTTPTITTACLPTTSFVGRRCWISGWDCETVLRNTRLGASFQLDSTSFVCAGGELGKDACTGDGGSPLVCPLGGRYFVVGLVAWGIGCGTSNVPGVYVNVISYIPWILSTANTN
ncbi:phenoloxidase-activating factor 2-like isoform X2 [Toxorhynchites rutilus septentrionalis]|uniref:phenoloxidase-activating factor 2-like isoform X2 n=1 Tax=Toxorhynchites rutilus septentrionalis TaxID=329112 RepID=UPI002478D6AD|nr:phenoloxidase-activating factor 2-like isoform X2 [Toxorhynchites rutilus septentrionalis]